MSGFCAFYCLDGAPCDPDLLARMRHSLAVRGEITGSWSEGPVGLAMTAWRPQRNQAHDEAILPYRWYAGAPVIAADIRLDQRAALLQKFTANGVFPDEEDDLALLATAYDLWGERCVEHLQGDFAFVVWDASRRRLFGARSPLGLRPFVYHANAQRFLCASEPRQLLVDPTIARDLDERWIAVWLTEGLDAWNATAFREIQELVPGHTICIDEQGVKVTPFWSPFPRKPLCLSSPQAYVEQFRELLFAVVRDHLRSADPVLIDLSGGLDSSSLVCLARMLAPDDPVIPPLVALHVSSHRYQEVDDRVYAQAVAQEAGAALHPLCYEDFPVLDGAFDARRWTSTPTIPTVFLTKLYQEYWQIAQEIGARGHVRGDFGDQLFSASLSYLTTLWEEQRHDAFWREVSLWQSIHGIDREELFAACVLKPQLQRSRTQPPRSERAPWVKPWVWKLSAELLEADDAFFRQACPDPLARHLFRWIRYHKAYVSMQEEIVAAGLETREPYTDLRLIDFVLATPPQYQIRADRRKFLLWASMDGLLPEVVRQRKEKGRISRLLFRGVAQHQRILRELIHEMPAILLPYLDTERLARSVDQVALGATVDQPTFFSALALVVWAHRLPWAGGTLR
jgi:asparagine synthase (glutamine-hydrolysing)